MTEREFTAVFVKSDGWWAAKVQEIPGVNTQGRTLEEARENLREALQLMLTHKREPMMAENQGLEVVEETIRLVS